MTERVRRPPLVSIALVSAAAVGAEIVLSRLLAVVHWHHFAYMIIGLALLGFGASGTFLALMHRRLLPRFTTAYLCSVAAFGFMVLAGTLLARELPFRAEALLWDPLQPGWLLLMFVVLALPFFGAATAIGLALAEFRTATSRVYAADLAGAGCGSVGVLLMLYVAWPEDALRVLAATGLLALGIGAIELRVRSTAWLLAAAGLGLVAVAALPAELLRFQPGPYKGLSQTLRIEGTRVLAERSSPLGRLTVIDSPRVPLRSAPGLSLASRSEPPPQLGVFTDGDDMQAVTAASTNEDRLSFLGETTSALAYRLATPRTVLVVGAGGGMDALRALQLGAGHVDVVEPDAQLVRLLAVELDGYTGGLFSGPAVRLVAGDVRGFVAAGGRRYDLVQLSMTGGSAGGLGGLSEDYLHTVESFRLLLAQLEPNGFLSMTRWAQVPPRDGLKLVATVAAALAQQGVDAAADRLLMIRGWQTVTLVVKNGAVTAEDVRRLRGFCDELSFDPVWFPGIAPDEVNVYNQLSGPWYFDGVRRLLGDGRDAFVRGYPFDIRPATDERPYFHNFFRWRMLADAMRDKDRGGMALLEAGYLLLAATFLLALLAALAMIVLPLVLFTSLAGIGRALRWRVLGYFTGIGIAFLFVEIAFLQKLVLLVHHPTVALALVLAIFLLAAGAGSAWSSRVPPQRSRTVLAGAVAVIVLLGTIYGLGFDALNAAIAGWTVVARALVAAALLAPLAFCMGLPFPLALRGLEGALVPWAWGINGCASVVSATLATLLAVDVGFTAVLALALALYAGVVAIFPAASRAPA